jgi:regulator of replication initiation timing
VSDFARWEKLEEMERRVAQLQAEIENRRRFEAELIRERDEALAENRLLRESATP